MAGTKRGFNANKFREKIRFVFTMEAPPEEDRQLTFHFTSTIDIVGPADGDSVPFDPTEPVTRTTRPPLKRPCDVQFVQVADEGTTFGVVVPAKLKVLLLDEDYDDVKDASFVIMNGDRYLRHYEPPSFGLFDVGLHEMVFIAENER
jgi:hypothetical protein